MISIVKISQSCYTLDEGALLVIKACGGLSFPAEDLALDVEAMIQPLHLNCEYGSVSFQLLNKDNL